MPKRPWAEGDESLAARKRAFNEELGALIASQRELRGVLQKDLAEKMGMSHRQWQRVEAGDIKDSPTIFFVAEISRNLGVPLEQLLPPDSDLAEFVMKPPAVG